MASIVFSADRSGLTLYLSNFILFVAAIETVTYKLAIEPLVYWVKGYVSGKGADQVKDSGVGSECGSGDSSCGGSNDSLDSGLSGEFHENLDTLVHQTNREDYTIYDVAHIARVKYGYSEDSADGIFFCILGNLETWNVDQVYIIATEAIYIQSEQFNYYR